MKMFTKFCSNHQDFKHLNINVLFTTVGVNISNS
jgi:hypothetical protein